VFFHFFSLFFFLLLSSLFKLFPWSQAASVATLPSALFFERLSLGASWVYSIQQVLLPGNRPLFPLAKETGPGLSRSHLISAVELGSWIESPFSLFCSFSLSSCLSQFFPEKFRARIA
jgi:hypothetical protein